MTAARWTETGGSAGRDVILLCNPLGAALEVWDPMVGSLRRQHRVVRYDSPGHGGSPLADGIDIRSLTEVAVGVLDAAGAERAHVVGLSLGGMVGLSLAAVHPSRVVSLSVVCSAAYFPDKELWRQRAALARSGGMAELADGSLSRWFTPAWAERNPAVIDDARAMFLATDPEGYARTAEALGALDLRPALGSVGCPTLVVAGDVDPSTPPAMLREIADGVPDARYEELAGAHWLPVEQSQALGALVLPFIEAAH
ncbi:3-oxoadipate enol-lactonase [Micromonospora pallida]|uniref:3-oxoadipate enol-lactonase n=1 Tax=Micromonospora pallida TaxID=145854 RepID=A0A1C6SIH2_9ACTN|nr:alpha/beta fold hydrolase [Micromonospora pallida]SCL29233.1 3-oxoadipate enol-lactonase [Micromonospora pallida]